MSTILEENEHKQRVKLLLAEWQPYQDKMLGILHRADALPNRRGLTDAERRQYDALEGPADLLWRKIELERQRFRRIEEDQRRRSAPVRPERPTISVSELQRLRYNGGTAQKVRAIAFHEAGHVVSMVLLGIPIERVYLAADGGGSAPARDSGLLPAEVYLAGDEATDLAGLTDVVGRGWSLSDIRNARKATSNYESDRKHARVLLRNNWPAVWAVTRALLQRAELSGEETERLVYDNLHDAARSRSIARRRVA